MQQFDSNNQEVQHLVLKTVSLERANSEVWVNNYLPPQLRKNSGFSLETFDSGEHISAGKVIMRFQTATSNFKLTRWS